MVIPTPAVLKPPSTPKNKTRSATSVVVSKMSIICPLESSFKIPPMRAADTSPPKSLPSTLTPIEAISMMGNFPSSKRPGSILTPSIAPLNVSPFTPLISVTLTERVMTKSSGRFSMSSHCKPIALMRIGRKEGHLKVSPEAAPMLRITANPGFALNFPLPRKAKFRASPPISIPPIFKRAPSDANDTISSLSAAPVFNMKSVAVRVRMPPI